MKDPYGFALAVKNLPDSEEPLQEETDKRDAHPAAESCQNGLSSGSYESDYICIQADCCHCHDNKKFAQ